MTVTANQKKMGDREFESEYKRLTEKEIERELILSNRFWLDCSLFKDIYIGALYSFFDDDQSSWDNLTKLIKERYETYATRYYVDPSYIFPEINISHEQVTERLYDPRYSSRILTYSPLTYFYQTLLSQLAVVRNHKEVKHEDDSDISLTLNLYPFKRKSLPERQIRLFGSFLSRYLNISNINFLSINPSEIDVEEFLKYDEYYLYYLKEYLDSSSLRMAFTELKFKDPIEKFFFFTKFYNYHPSKDLIKVQEKTILSELIYAETRLSSLSRAKFIQTKFISAIQTDK